MNENVEQSSSNTLVDSDMDMLIGVAKHIAATSPLPKRVKSSLTFLAMQESIKEKIVSIVYLKYLELHFLTHYLL